MFMLGHGFLQLGDLCLLLLNNTSQVFDTVVVRQLVLGHLEPVRAAQLPSQSGEEWLGAFVFSERSIEKQKVTEREKELPIGAQLQ